MSDYKVSGVKRRDFRSVKDAPETPPPQRRKKTHKPFEIWYRRKDEVWEKERDSWYTSDEERAQGNIWRKYWGCAYATETGAQQALCHLRTRRYERDRYEYKIVKAGA